MEPEMDVSQDGKKETIPCVHEQHCVWAGSISGVRHTTLSFFPSQRCLGACSFPLSLFPSRVTLFLSISCIDAKTSAATGDESNLFCRQCG